jgi:septation ring formation regulator
MNNLINLVQGYYIYFLIGLVAILILFVMIFKNKHFKQARINLEELEVRYNKVKSIPLLFKLNKATAIAKTNESTKKLVDTCKVDYDFVHKNINEISRLLIESQDLIQVRKTKEVNDNILNLDSLLDIADTQVFDLENKLNVVLEKEAEQRNKVTAFKQKYQTIKLNISTIQQSISFSEKSLLEFCAEIEDEFSTFEEWMYLSEYEKSENIIEAIESNVNQLDVIVKQLPSLISDAKGVIPNLIDELKSDVVISKQRRVFIKHLEIEKNIDAIEEAIKIDLQHIQRCDVKDIDKNILEIKERLLQMRTSVKRENESFSELKIIVKKVDSLSAEIDSNYKFVSDMKSTVENKVDNEKFKSSKIEYDKVNIEAKEYKSKLDKIIISNNIPNSSILLSYKELFSMLDEINTKLLGDRKLIVDANSDEKHAQDQLLKLQLIMNEMCVKIQRNKLPQISDQYDKDMNKAKTYVNLIKKLLDELPMNLTLINSTVEEAIDYVYSLYNNVNNVVGMALMVENTIVFGNKYRSENDGVDSDLSKAELFYQNGEYTHALTVAIDAIEKIFPNDFEKIIKERVVNGK